MPNTLVQFRIHEKQRKEAEGICEQLGFDLPSYLRMSVTRLVREKGVPFNLCVAEDKKDDSALWNAISELQASAKANGLSEMSLKEIDAEIAAARAERAADEDSPLLEAMRENRTVEVLIQSSRNRREVLKSGCPLKIFVSTRSGRRYVCMYSGKRNSFPCFRLDQIKEVKCTDPVPEKERKTLLARLEERSVYVWGVSGITENSGMQKLVLTIHADEDSEAYIVQRLIREGEGGTVERTAEDTFRYEKTVTDVMEMFPWIRSFIGRIEGLKIYGTDGSGEMKEDAELESRFYRDLQKMYRMYEI